MVRGKLISSLRTCNTAALPRTWFLCFLLSSIIEVVFYFHEFHQKKAHSTHCHAHSITLSVKDATSHCKILSDTVNNTNEIVKLVKFSPKRENLLGQIKSNIELYKMKKKAFQHPV